VLASIFMPDHIQEVETVIVRALRKVYSPLLSWALGAASSW